jgi:response regulator RpfG family c-di-GMP phosphodiesterase
MTGLAETPIAPGARILCVDDDPAIGGLLARVLGGRYEVVTANSPAAALGTLATSAPFAVVVSDYRMPGSDGVTLLGQVRELSPDTVRILLTGNGDLDIAMDAVNLGQVFRFLAKPCTPDILRSAVAAAVEQHRLVTAERVLLEQTLRGSVKALTDVIALAQPSAFGRATRVRRHATELAERVGVRDRWPIEIAAMLSQVGAGTLQPVTLERYHAGEPLTEAEQAAIASLPATAERLIADIPRLEAVREILRFQDTPYEDTQDRGSELSFGGERIPIGSRILKIALDFDLLELRGLSSADALETMRLRAGCYDPRLLGEFGTQRMGNTAETAAAALLDMRLAQVRLGMVFATDVRAESGVLLIARGQEVGVSLVDRIRHQWDEFASRCVVSMLVPNG